MHEHNEGRENWNRRSTDKLNDKQDPNRHVDLSKPENSITKHQEQKQQRHLEPGESHLPGFSVDVHPRTHPYRRIEDSDDQGVSLRRSGSEPHGEKPSSHAATADRASEQKSHTEQPAHPDHHQARVQETAAKEHHPSHAEEGSAKDHHAARAEEAAPKEHHQSRAEEPAPKEHHQSRGEEPAPKEHHQSRAEEPAPKEHHQSRAEEPAAKEHHQSRGEEPAPKDHHQSRTEEPAPKEHHQSRAEEPTPKEHHQSRAEESTQKEHQHTKREQPVGKEEHYVRKDQHSEQPAAREHQDLHHDRLRPVEQRSIATKHVEHQQPHQEHAMQHAEHVGRAPMRAPQTDHPGNAAVRSPKVDHASHAEQQPVRSERTTHVGQAPNGGESASRRPAESHSDHSTTGHGDMPPPRVSETQSGHYTLNTQPSVRLEHHTSEVPVRVRGTADPGSSAPVEQYRRLELPIQPQVTNSDRAPRSPERQQAKPAERNDRSVERTQTPHSRNDHVLDPQHLEQLFVHPVEKEDLEDIQQMYGAHIHREFARTGEESGPTDKPETIGIESAVLRIDGNNNKEEKEKDSEVEEEPLLTHAQSQASLMFVQPTNNSSSTNNDPTSSATGGSSGTNSSYSQEPPIDAESVLPNLNIGEEQTASPVPQESVDNLIAQMQAVISDASRSNLQLANEVFNNLEQGGEEVVRPGDTLESIAKRRLGYAVLAELLFRINMKKIPTKIIDSENLQLTLLPGTKLQLPTKVEVRQFLVQPPRRRRKFHYQHSKATSLAGS